VLSKKISLHYGGNQHYQIILQKLDVRCIFFDLHQAFLINCDNSTIILRCFPNEKNVCAFDDSSCRISEDDTHSMARLSEPFCHRFSYFLDKNFIAKSMIRNAVSLSRFSSKFVFCSSWCTVATMCPFHATMFVFLDSSRS